MRRCSSLTDKRKKINYYVNMNEPYKKFKFSSINCINLSCVTMQTPGCMLYCLLHRSLLVVCITLNFSTLYYAFLIYRKCLN